MTDLYGNLEGLKSSQVKSLKALYDRRLPQDRFVTPELARRLTELARELHRQLGVTVDRVGTCVRARAGGCAGGEQGGGNERDGEESLAANVARSHVGLAPERGAREIRRTDSGVEEKTCAERG